MGEAERYEGADMTALAVALVLIAALAWDAYRRTLALRRVDELEELRAGLMDVLDKVKAKASTGHVEALEADLKRLRTDVELGGIGKRR